MSRARWIFGAFACWLLILPAEAVAKRELRTGFATSNPSAQAEQPAYLDKVVASGAGIERVFISWREIATGKPQSPEDPSDPAYDFSSLDRIVAGVEARGLDILLDTTVAPDWAEGARRPASAPTGTWKPDPGALASFEKALATRYSGSFAGLPRVRYFQIFNEPNLSVYLTPQWKGKKFVSAIHYRKMLNASTKAIHSVDQGNRVVTAGLAPYGDAPGGQRSRPLTFWRKFFCLSRKLKRTCRSKSNFDILAEHAINTSGPPTQSALNRDDASSGDLPAFRRILRAAEKRKTAVGKHHGIWVTELWWESNPPDKTKQGLRLKTQARYVEETMYLAWKAGATAAINLQVIDSPYTQATKRGVTASGVYFEDGSPKPSLTAFRFPFVADRGKGSQVKLWGKAPSGARVIIERKHGKAWRRVKSLKAKSSGIFSGKTRIGGGSTNLRARYAGETSLVWRLGK